MTTVGRFDGDVRITGNLQVDGSLPSIARSEIQQETLAEFVIPWTHWRVFDALGTNLPGAAANDDLGLAGGTWATNSASINAGDVKTTSSTRYARVQLYLPPEYDAGETVVLRFSAAVPVVCDSSCSLDAVVYKSDEAAGIGSDICATAAQSINSTAFADYDFTVTPTGLTAGDILDVRIAVSYADAATTDAVTPTIGAAKLCCDIRG